MRSSFTASFICIVFLTSCLTQTEDSLSDANVSVVKNFEGSASDSCFDVQMEVWMEKFQHYQQTGSDMFSADSKAREASLQAFRDCHERKSRAIVDNEARKD